MNWAHVGQMRTDMQCASGTTSLRAWQWVGLDETNQPDTCRKWFAKDGKGGSIPIQDTDLLDPIHNTDLDRFTLAYLTCALWASHDDDGEFLDASCTIDDLSPEALGSAIVDCAAFQADFADLLAKAGTDEQNGHDYWLTRNRHGAGFWDRGYPPIIGRTLSDAAKSDGSVDLYVDDDGQVYGG